MKCKNCCKRMQLRHYVGENFVMNSWVYECSNCGLLQHAKINKKYKIIETQPLFYFQQSNEM